MKISKNHWETQPRKRNGEFTFRNGFTKRIIENVSSTGKTTTTKVEPKGGSYKELRKITAGNKKVEIHHMPAKSSSYLSKSEGPCIIMDKEDHKKTSSYGNTTRAKRYRAWQKKLIEEGKFLEAERMDIKNLIRKFGDKYTNGIKDKLIYEKRLEKEGIIHA